MTIEEYWEMRRIFDEIVEKEMEEKGIIDDERNIYVHPVHGKVVEQRFDAWHDVTVYEDGYEERFYIGD